MKVLHVLNSRIYSGAEKVVCTIIRNMPPQYQCTYLSPKGPVEEQLKKWNIEYFGVERLNTKEIKKALGKIQPDVVHAHDFRASVLCAAVINKDRQLISHIHCNPSWINRINKNTILYRLASVKCAKIISVSETFLKEYYWSRAIQKKTYVAGNPFSIEQILTCQNVGTGNLCYDAAFVGRLEPEKGPLQFLEIINELKKKRSSITAVMVGAGNLRSACEAYVKETCMERNVSFAGFQENPYQYMEQARFLVIPSQWEGFGLVAVEAMALGKPVIAAAVGGLKQNITDQCGRLCTSREDFVQEAERLLADGAYYQRKSDSARRQAAGFDNMEQYMEKLILLYGENAHEA